MIIKARMHLTQNHNWGRSGCVMVCSGLFLPEPPAALHAQEHLVRTKLGLPTAPTSFEVIASGSKEHAGEFSSFLIF